MKDGFDIGIVSSGAMMKKGYSLLIANVGKTVALITLIITALVSFTEISFSGFESESFSSTLVMMLISSYVMYFSLEDAGEKLGRESDEYKAASEKYTELQGRIKGCDIALLRKFCLDYRNAELEYRRSNLLFSLGYSKEEYEDYLKVTPIRKKAKRELRRVKRIKRAELDAASLLSVEGKRSDELTNPERGRVLSMIIKLIPSTVCTLFTISVMISVKDNLTAAGVIEALLKLSTLPVIGLKGYSGGYEYVTGSEIAWINTKCRLLDAFVKSNN